MVNGPLRGDVRHRRTARAARGATSTIWTAIAGSRPVRIGNAAAEHLQLDIYGELMDSIYLYDKYGEPISYEMWQQVERMLDWVAETGQQADQSIWEVRGRTPAVHLFEAAVLGGAGPRRCAWHGSASVPDQRHRWSEHATRIYRAIMRDGWNADSAIVHAVFRR